MNVQNGVWSLIIYRSVSFVEAQGLIVTSVNATRPHFLLPDPFPLKLTPDSFSLSVIILHPDKSTIIRVSSFYPIAVEDPKSQLFSRKSNTLRLRFRFHLSSSKTKMTVSVPGCWKLNDITGHQSCKDFQPSVTEYL